MKFGMSSRSVAQPLLQIVVIADALQRSAEEAHGRLLPGHEEVCGDAGDVDGLGCRAVGKRGLRHPGHHVGARFVAPVFDVRDELVVEEFEWVLRHRVAGAADGARVPAASDSELLSEQVVIALGHTEQVRYYEHRERLAVLADELARAPADELVDLLVGESPHRLLVLAHAFRRHQPHQQPAVRRVQGRIEGEHLVGHRQLAAVLFDQGADVVALEWHREPGERPVGELHDENVAVSL